MSVYASRYAFPNPHANQYLKAEFIREMHACLSNAPWNEEVPGWACVLTIESL